MKKISKGVEQKVLELTQSVYKEYEDRLFVEKLVHQDLKDIVMIGLDDPEGKLNLSQHEKDKLQAYLDSGILEQTEKVPDWNIAKEYEAEIDKRLLEAIEKGVLPKYTLTFLKKKTRKYVRRNKGDNK